MNIKITKQEHELLEEFEYDEFIFGSKLYGTDNDRSDTDIIRIFTPQKDTEWLETSIMYPNIHQFQYDDKKNQVQYTWTYKMQFLKNLISGDSIVNAEVSIFSLDIPLEYVYTYNIIKAFLGFAKRDIKNQKMFHARRCLYIAESLLNKELPTLDGVKTLVNEKNPSINFKQLREVQDLLREQLNDTYDKGRIPRYYVEPTASGDMMLDKLLKANNIKEFRY